MTQNKEFLNKMWKFQEPRKGIYRGDQEKVMWKLREHWM